MNIDDKPLHWYSRPEFIATATKFAREKPRLSMTVYFGSGPRPLMFLSSEAESLRGSIAEAKKSGVVPSLLADDEARLAELDAAIAKRVAEKEQAEKDYAREHNHKPGVIYG